MPRDGSGQYSQPFPDVVEGTTIESAVYNGFTHDVEIDLNAPRPISSGGTGATNAADAMAALGGEGSKIEVLNYDSHPFTAGSFYSKASATNPPVAAHAFAGICYVAVVSGIATSDMFIEVRDRDEATQPGSLYVRQKKNGTWSGWLKAVGTSMSGTPPASPTDGMFWWDPTRGKLFVWYSDPNTAQWVEAVAMPDMNPDDFVRIDAPQTLTPTQQTQGRKNIYAAPFDALAYSGMQINGSMDISQEKGTGATTVTGQHVCDGWRLGFGGTMALSASPSTTAFVSNGFSTGVLITVPTAQASLGAGDYMQLFQRVEGYRVARLAWGTVNAQSITIGFWTAHKRTGIYGLVVRNSGSARAYAAIYTQNVADVAQYNTITVPGDTTGTWLADSTIGMEIVFSMGCGTTFTAPSTNTWVAGNYIAAPGQINAVAATSDLFRITGVVVLPGIEAPSAARAPLIMRPYDQELVMCRRYWAQAMTVFVGNVTSGGQYNSNGFLPRMRANPTLTGSNDFNSGFPVAVGLLGFSYDWVYDIRTANATQVGNFRTVIFADARL